VLILILFLSIYVPKVTRLQWQGNWCSVFACLLMKHLRTSIARKSSGKNVHTERRHVRVRPNHLTKFTFTYKWK